MPLSDHERQVLAAMEAALEKEDPKLVSTLSALPSGGKGIGIGALGVILGMAILIGGLVSKSVLVGALGFIFALVGTIIALNALLHGQHQGANQAKPKKSARGSWSDRMNDRWDKRSQ